MLTITTQFSLENNRALETHVLGSFANLPLNLSNAVLKRKPPPMALKK